MADFDYITDTGVIVPDTSELLETVQGEYTQALGDDLNLNASTPQGRLIEAEVEARRRMLVNNAALANVINPEQSFGIYLDALCALSGVTRIAGTASRVLASLQGVPGTYIPANSRVQSTVGDMWYLENDVTIPAVGNITAYFISGELGPFECPVGSLTKIIDATLGWETVTNNTPAEPGVTPESDTDLKARRKQNLFRGVSLMESIQAALNLVPNIRSSFVYENYTSAPITYQGITIDAHSIYVVADGGADADVAQAIFNSKSDGCGYTGNVTVNVLDEIYGISYPVSFNRPTTVNITANITVAVPPQSGVSVGIEDAVKNAVLAYEQGSIPQVDGLKVGTDVSPFEIASAINIQIPDVFVTDVKVAKQGGTPAAASIPININEVANIGANNITVTVVATN